MSRIGKKSIAIPKGISAELSGRIFKVKGPNGTRNHTVGGDVTVELADDEIRVLPRGSSKRARQQWGMTRTMIANCVAGAASNFKKELEITGVGYRAQMRGSTLNLTLGLSHDVNYEIPDGVKVTALSTTRLLVEGADKQQVGQVAANIRKWRPPEPFKGKGIRYKNEIVFRKVGKKK